jgi:hypothetical protein
MRGWSGAPRGGSPIEPRTGKVLRSLFDRRSGADYDLADAPDRAEGERAIADAEGFVDAIGTWMLERRAERQRLRLPVPARRGVAGVGGAGGAESLAIRRGRR